ncbi:UNVERIFIED_CONTAM: hypothetical protein RMT77_002788 [Armadillidium vulgare]
MEVENYTKRESIPLIPVTNDYSKIEEGLFLGNLQAATNIDTLKLLQISHIVTVELNPLPPAIYSIPGLQFMYINVYDMANEDLLSHFPKINEFISDGQEKGNVLVHCYHGVSRSACIVVAYLMKKYDIYVDSALERVKAKRNEIKPNSGFICQLHYFRDFDFLLSIKNPSYRLFRLISTKIREQFKKKTFNGHTSDIIFENFLIKDSTPYAKCRSCRVVLLYEDSVILHRKGEMPKWNCPNYNKDEIFSCKLGIFSLPYKWMTDISDPQGKLRCYNCGQKIGSFNWIKGHACPCNVAITPGFFITPSKVDLCPNIRHLNTLKC